MPPKSPSNSHDGHEPRPRCPNCHTKFTPKRAHQKFCVDNCRKEYHRYGGAVPKVRDAVLKELPALIASQMEKERAELDRLLKEARGERHELIKLIARMEAAKAPAQPANLTPVGGWGAR